MKRYCVGLTFLMLFILIGSSIPKVYASESIPEISLNKTKARAMDFEGVYVPLSQEISEDNNINSTDLYKETNNVVEVISLSNNKVLISKDDIDLMSKTVSAESKGEPYEGKVAVASVILNRTSHPSFPKTIRDVIIQKNAFSCVRDNTVYENPDDSCYSAVMDAIKGNDPTNKAVFFYNPNTATSKWMKNINKSNVKAIGNHVFFDVN
ncbi:spore-cortex-lytic enzyme [Clostridium putrefaciens]|uniref:Spore-cortex-lytic enzyme n=1 Tax=Clostridium putrefaciens TaxID=99675 RepID=A0A381JAG4_9CLOT|nr:cell wall hydrolase [Clostridium putrefaciens]SUY48201.1 spore-cortex-lytic enzyme [Clostridium putrefaciens]